MVMILAIRCMTKTKKIKKSRNTANHQEHVNRNQDTRKTPGRHQEDTREVTRRTQGRHQEDTREVTRRTQGRHQEDTRKTPGRHQEDSGEVTRRTPGRHPEDIGEVTRGVTVPPENHWIGAGPVSNRKIKKI